LAGLAHQELPFEYLVQTLEEDRSNNYGTSFAVQIINDTETSQQEGLAGPTFASFPIRALGILPDFLLSNVAFIFHIKSLSTKMTMSLTYRANSRDAKRAQSILESLQAVIARMVAGTDLSDVKR
jgi:hypothetical protein